MSGTTRAALAERRAQLVTRAHLDRARLSLALHQVHAIVFPAPDPARGARVRPAAAAIIGIALPLFGMTRFARLLRIASFALTAYRIARNWNGGR